jgi:hypothetical protein
LKNKRKDKMIFKLSSFVSLLATAVAAADLTAANLIQNGGFERYEASTGQSPCFGTRHINCFQSDAKFIAPWTVTSAQKTYFLRRADTLGPGIKQLTNGGRWALTLNGYGAVTIGQQVSIVSGKTYKVTFASAGDPIYCSDIKKMSGFVELAGVKKIFSFTPNSNWYTLSFTFAASKTGNALLKIGSTTPGSDNCGPLIDNISLLRV